MISRTTNDAVKRIAVEDSLPVDVVRKVIQRFVGIMCYAVSNEQPFRITGFGTFYHKYRRCRSKEHFKQGKVAKRLCFMPIAHVRFQYENLVGDIGIKNNLPTELKRAAIVPDEIMKARQNELLKYQQELGFTPDLLFDDENLHEVDRLAIKKAGRPLTVSEVLERLHGYDPRRQ